MFKYIADRIAHFIDPETLRPSTVFRSGEGLSPWHVHCEDPYDMGPAADTIMKAITKTRAEMATSGDTRPLVVMLGEEHRITACHALQKAVLTRLLHSNLDFAVRYEFSHNLWGTLATQRMNLPVSKDLNFSASAYDPRGRAVLSALAGFCIPDYAPAGMLDLAAFCLRHDIKTMFNDAAKTPRGELDFNDPATRRAAKTIGVKQALQMQKDAPVRIALRNEVMANRPFESNLIVQIGGSAHIFGQAAGTYIGGDHENSYEQSLSKAYERAGARTLPVFPVIKSGRFGLNAIPREAYHRITETVVVDGLPERFFYEESSALRRGAAQKADAEKRFITEHLHDSTAPMKTRFIDVARARSAYQKQAREEALKVLCRYAANGNRPETAPALRKA